MYNKDKRFIGPKSMTLEERNQNIFALLKANIPPKEIADLYGLSVNTIHTMKSQNLDIRGIREERDKQIWHYIQAFGLSPNEIAEELGMSTSSVYKRIDYILQEKGISKEEYKETRKLVRSFLPKDLEPDLDSNPEIDIDSLIDRFEKIKKLLNIQYQDDCVNPKTEEIFVLISRLLSNYTYRFSVEDLHQLSYCIMHGQRTSTKSNVEWAIKLLISQDEIYLATKLLEEFTTDGWNENPADFKQRMLNEITAKRKEMENAETKPSHNFGNI